MSRELLEKAGQIVYMRAEESDRKYGPIVESFRRTAIIASKLTGKELTSIDIVKIQMSLKLSRESYCHKEDNLLDLIAYTTILNDLENEEISHYEKAEH